MNNLPAKIDSPPDDLLLRMRRLGLQLIALQRRKGELEAQIAEVNRSISKIDTEFLPELFRMAQSSEVVFDDGKWKISIEPNIQASFPKEQDKAARAFAWLTKNKFGGMIKSELAVSYAAGELSKAKSLAAKLMKEGLDVSFDQKIHPQTLKAWVRERLKGGKPIPPEIEYIDVSKAVVKIDKQKARESESN